MAPSVLPRFKRRTPAANPDQHTPADNHAATPLTPAPVDIIDVPDAEDKEKSSPEDFGSEEFSSETGGLVGVLADVSSPELAVGAQRFEAG
ncbi:hypothetical protein BGZ73_003588 [Actinomortierella ambigua]|nr:hypothetical protein BGZ73_003588 [Actinomortierella ambigua]